MPQPLPGLNCPIAPASDPAIVDDLNQRLNHWMQGLAIPEADQQRLTDIDCGMFAAFCFTGAAGPQHRVLGAKWITTVCIIDDYCDRPRHGDVRPSQWLDADLIGLDRAGRAFSPPHPSTETPPLRMLRSARLAAEKGAGADAADRVARTVAMSLHLHTAEALWRATGSVPTVEAYLRSLHTGAYRVVIDLIDIVGDYTLPATVTAHPAMRRIVRAAAEAMDLLNDCYSAHCEPPGEANIITVLMAERGYTRAEALDTAIRLHNHAMTNFDNACADLRTYRLPETDGQQRFIEDLRAWVAGNHAWHLNTHRYDTDTGSTP